MDFGLATKMQNESQFEIRRAEVAEKLRGRIRMQVLRRFDFQDQLFVDDHVEYLSCEWFTTVINLNRRLALNSMPLGHEIPMHGEHVDVLTKSVAE